MIQEYTGRAPYFPNYADGSARLLLAVMCFVGDHPQEIYALLDTAAEWCVIPPSIAVRLGLDDVEPEEPVFLSSRFGVFQGQLERIPLTLNAADGESLPIQATCFVSADWPGPMVIGWRGCLERMNFGFNNTEEAFYFAAGD